MDKTLFLESKISEDLSSGVFNNSEIMSKTIDRKKSEKGFQKTEENFDFTSDIIDLLLCVENDENARQNIESIMDQWDEMNILEDDGLKSSVVEETNAQIKIKNVENSEDIKLPLKKSQETELILSEEPEKLIINSNVHVQDGTKIMKDCDSNKQIPAEAKIIINFDDKKFPLAEAHNHISDQSNSVPTNSQKIISESSMISKPKVDAPATVISELTRNQPSNNCQLLNTFSYSQNQFQTITEELLKKEQIAKSDDDKLTERIKNLSCAVCHKSHEQLMSSGEIKKMQCKPYPCPFCRGNYYQKSSANIHMKVHMEEESLKCRLCVDASEKLRKAFKHDANTDIESADQTGKRLKLDTFICSICSLSLSSQLKLLEHMTTHKNNTLKFCRKYVKKQPSDYEYHKKTNGDFYGSQKSKNCRKCAKTVAPVQRQGKYECKTCGKRFMNKSNFDFHCASHNRKFKNICNNITEKNNCSSLDHSYGKPMIVASDDRIGRGTDENENLKTSKSKTVNSGLQLGRTDSAGNQNIGTSLMDVDESNAVVENYVEINRESANEFNSTTFDKNVAPYDCNLSTYVQISEASSKTQTVYVVKNRVFNEDTSSNVVGSSLPESPLLNNAFFSQYLKPEARINAEVVGADQLFNVNEANDGLKSSSLNEEKNVKKCFSDSHIVFQQNFDVETGIMYKNSILSYDGSNLSNLTNFNNGDMLNSGLVMNDSELQTDELMSTDIDNIFQQYFYAQSDEKILSSNFTENVDVNLSHTQFSMPNQILPITACDTENRKIEKTVIYNSTADTLSQFINTNISDDNELESNEIIQELFSNIDGTESEPNNNRHPDLNGIPMSVAAQKNIFAAPEPNLCENKNSPLISKSNSNLVKIQNANSVINLANNSTCLNNVLANISNLALVPATKGETTGSVLINQNQNSNPESNVTNGKTSTASPKSYLVIYVLPSSNGAQTSANSVVTPNEQNTVTSSITTKDTLFKLPTVEGKTTYLVPIITNKANNANRINEFSLQKGRTSNVNSGVRKCERVQKSRSVHKNYDGLKNSFKAIGQNKNQPSEHNGKHDVKNESLIAYTNGKCNNSFVGLPNNKSNEKHADESDKVVLKYDSDLKSPTVVSSTQDENTPSVLKTHCVVNTAQKSFRQASIKGKCNKRNILQIAYDDACKLIEDSVTKNVKNNVNPVKNSSMISTNCSGIQVTTKNVTIPKSATTSSSTLTGNYTLLKQMLNSKSYVPENTAQQNDDKKISQVPVEISFTNGQVTFQYSQNNVKEEGKQDDVSSAQHVFQNTETSACQLTSLVVKSDTQEKCICEICHKTFPKSEFLSHMKTHNKTLYKCTYCQEIFVQQLNLIQHMRTHLQPQVFNCKMCKKSFTNVLLFRLHLLVHKGLLFICVSCIKLFNKKEEYENHLKTHNQNYLTCTQCKRNFPNDVNDSSVIQYFTCIECISSGQKLEQNEFLNENKETQLGALNTNVSVHHEQGIGNSFIKQEPNTESAECRVNEFEEDFCFLCQYCDQICNGGVEFKNHKVFHLKNKIKCVVCGEHFGKFSTLKHHLKTHEVKRMLKCDFCSDTFRDRTLYQNHAHENFKPYPCAICEESFDSKAALIVHVANHVGDSEFICNYCGLKFLSNGPQTMLKHKQNHITENIAECDKCDETFMFQSELKIHSLETHNEQLLCALCNQIFENSESYANHRKTHDLFKCNKCNFVFANETLLSKHKQQTHVENVFSCKHCSLEFNEFNELLTHTIKLHAGKDLKCFKCSCCSRFFTNELQWTEHGKQVEKKAVLLPYSLKQFSDRSFKLEPDTKNMYSCHQCNENFRNKNEIIKHIKSH